MEDHTSPSVSRRSFVGMLSALPAVVGGFLLPFDRQAQAEELGMESDVWLETQADTRPTTPFTKIVIAKSDEVGIVVADVANNDRKPVVGADVKLTSRSNNKVVSGKTNADGVVLLKIKDLTEKEQNENGGEIYRGYAKMTVECKGYRKFHTGCVSIEGGRGFMAPTRSTATDKEPAYPILATFDEWDILYTNNCFAITSANDMYHTLRFEVATQMARATVSLFAKNGDKLATGELTTKNGEGSVEFKDLYLLRSHRKQIPKGKDFTLVIEGDKGKCTYPLAMEVTEGVTQATAPGTSKVMLSPFWPSGTGEKPSFTVPKSWGFIGGQKIQVVLPEAPFDFFYDPFGYIRIGYRSDEYSRESKYVRGIDGTKKEKDDEWKRHPRKSFQEQMEKAANDREAMKKKVGTAIHSRKGSKVQNVEFSRTIAGKLSFSAAAAGKHNEELWRMNAFAELLFTFNFSHSQQLIIGPIPAVLEYGVMMSAAAGVSFGLMSPEMMRPDKYSIDFGSSGISLTLVISPSISFGVGIKGILSASLKGNVSVTFTAAMRKNPPDGGKALKNPNLIFGAEVKVDVVLQAFIFTKTFSVFSLGDPELYNNWKGGLKAQGEDYDLLAQAEEEEVDFAGFFDEASIVTEEDLMEVIEFYDDSDDAELELTTASEDEAVPGLQQISRQVEMYTEDGEPYLCTVIELVTRVMKEEGPAEAQDGEQVPQDSVSDEPSVDTLAVESEDATLASQTEAYDSLAGEDVVEGGKTQFMGTMSDELVEETTENEADSAQAVLQNEASDVPSADAVTVDAETFEVLRTQAVGVDEDGALLVPYADEVVWDETAKLKSYKAESAGHDYAGLVDSDAPSFSRVASNMGLVPSPESDICIAKNVFSDPRPEIVTMNGSTYIFRIATVKLKNGNARSRIVYHKINGGKAGPENVLDFPIKYRWDQKNVPEVKMEDLFVYDFDIIASPVVGHPEVSLVKAFIISGKREHGNKTTFGQAACDQVFTVAVFVFNKDTVTVDRSISYLTNGIVDFDAAGGGTDYPYHSFSCPHIELIEDKYQGRPTWAFMLFYIDRAGKTPEEAMGKDARVGLGCCIANAMVDRIFSFCDLMKKNVGNLGGGIYEMVRNRRVRADDQCGWNLVMLRGREGDNTVSHHVLVKSSAAWKRNASTDYIPSVRAVTKLRRDTGNKPADASDKAYEALRLVDWPGHAGEYLVSKDGKLQRVKLVGLNTSNPTLGDFVPCGPSMFNVNGFGVDPTGNVVYWPAAGDTNPGYTYDQDGKAKKNTGTPVNVVLASRLHGTTFSDPFVYAEVKHDMQSVQVIEHFDPSKLALLSVDMTRAEKGSADIYFTLIPRVKCANVIGCASVSPFAYPGENVEFELTVRNDGNTYLTVFTAQLRLKGSDGVVSEAKLNFTKDTIRASSHNPMGANGKLEGVEDDFSLAPGKTSLYSVKLPIPKTWSNEKEVTVTAKDATIVQEKSSSLKPHADGDEYIEEYLVDSDEDWEYAERPYDVVDVWYEDGVDDEWEEDYLDSPMITDNPNGSGNGSSGGTGGNSGGGFRFSGQGQTAYRDPRAVAPYGGYAGPESRGVTYSGGTGDGSGVTAGPSRGTGAIATDGGTQFVGGSTGATPGADGAYTGSAATAATGGTAATGAGGASGVAAGGGTAGTAGTGGVVRTTSLANTADATTSAGVPLALGLAGAAMLAYSKRRERMEREGMGDCETAHPEDG